MKKMRKNTIVKYCGKDKKLVEIWGEKFKVKSKEKDFLRLISIQNPEFGVCATVPCKDCVLIEK